MRTNRKSGIFVLAGITAIILAFCAALIVLVAPRAELTANAASDEIEKQQTCDAASAEQGVYAENGAGLCVLYKVATEDEATDNTNAGGNQSRNKTSGMDLPVEWIVVFAILLFLIFILMILSISLATIIIKRNKDIIKLNSRLKDDEYCLQIYEQDKYKKNMYTEHLYADQIRDLYGDNDDYDDLDDDDDI